MGRIMINGKDASYSSNNANNIKYDNSASELSANNVQDAIDNTIEKINTKYSKPSTGIPASDLANGVIPTTLPASDVKAWAKADSKPSYTASEVGALSNTTTHLSGDVPTTRKVNGKALSSDITLTASDVEALPSTTTHLSGDIASSEKGMADGVATLGTDGKVPSSQLPSYVDDVLEYSAKASFPTTGESGKIYVDTSDNKTYRWSGTAYVEISPSIVIGTTTGTAFDGKSGKDHVDNTTVHITSAERTAWNNKQNAITSSNKLSASLISGLPTSLPANGGTATNVSGTVAIANGGTGATTAANARTNLGLGGASTKSVDTSISAASTSANLPTSAAVASFVEGKGYITSVSDKMDKANPVGTGSFSMNRNVYSEIGTNSATLGYGNTASGDRSIALGSSNTASGGESIALGYDNTTSGINSIALGSYNTTSGNSSLAFGEFNTSTAYCSYASGVGSTASGVCSHAEGYVASAIGDLQYVQGTYNIPLPGDGFSRTGYAHIVGNGTEEEPSNAYTLDWNGNAWFAGKVSADNGFDLSSDDISNGLGYTPPSQNIAGLLPTTEIPKNANLNTLEYCNVGRYYCPMNTTVATLSNCPTGSAFVMEVYSPLSKDTSISPTGDVYRVRKILNYRGIEYIQCITIHNNTPTYDAWHINNILDTWFNRPTDANIATIGDGKLIHYKATSSMTSNKPNSDGHIIQLNWDNKNGYDSQLFIPNNTTYRHSMQYRSQNAGTWDKWHDILAVDTTGNPISSTSNDTVANWREIGSGIYYFNKTGCLTDQPSQYGLLMHMNVGYEIRQVWYTQASGNVYHRGGNQNGWSGTWRQFMDEWKLVKTVTGKTSVALPSKWQELHVMVSDGNDMNFDMSFIYNIVKTIGSKNHRHGWYQSSSNYGDIVVTVSTTTVTLFRYSNNGTDKSSTAKVYVYYR